MSAPLETTVNVPEEKPAAPVAGTLPMSADVHGVGRAVAAGTAAKIGKSGLVPSAVALVAITR
jgi:hypothetical protein